MMPELQPCPFCGSTTAPTVMNQNEAQWLDNDAENPSMVVCCAAKKFGCGASTGFCDTAEQAVEAWNRRASDWIPCSERLPEIDGNYLCISNHEIKILPYRNGVFYSICFDAVLRCCNSSVTHWTPLPEPPKEVPHVD